MAIVVRDACPDVYYRPVSIKLEGRTGRAETAAGRLNLMLFVYRELLV